MSRTGPGVIMVGDDFPPYVDKIAEWPDLPATWPARLPEFATLIRYERRIFWAARKMGDIDEWLAWALPMRVVYNSQGRPEALYEVPVYWRIEHVAARRSTHGQ